MLKGRLGLATARIPHADRHGMVWLARGQVYVESGTLHFRTAGGTDLEAGDYALPFQMISCLVLQPGTAVSHDALRLLARHSTTLLCVGEDGVRFYASLPAGPDHSARARRQAEIWSNPLERVRCVHKLYEWRLGETLVPTDLDALRGIEGARMKETYRQLAAQFGIVWKGRRYDRNAPEETDIANQAINHAASAVEGAALTAVAATGAIPQLGFIHEDSANSFALDIADLFRDDVLLPIAFGATRRMLSEKTGPVEKIVRHLAGETLRRDKVVTRMIDRIKELLDADDDRRDP